MAVYVIAFVLTVILVNFAVDYRKKYFKLTSTEGLATLQHRGSYKGRIDVKYVLLLLLAVFPLFFVSAVRYGIGTDYFFTYVPEFYNILAGQRAYSETGFYLFNRAIQLFTDNPQWLFVITSFIFVSLFIRTVVKYSTNVTVSIAVLFFSCVYFASLNNVRQAIAVVIVFAAFPYLVRGNFFRYLLCVLAAFCFHQSAVLMLVPYIAINWGFIRRHFLAFGIIITLLLPVECTALKMVFINTKYFYYFVSDFNNGNANTLNIIYNLFFFILSYLILGKRYKKDKFAYMLLVMQFAAFWISSVSLFIRISEMISRITVFFQIFQVLLIPYCISVQRSLSDKITVALMFLLPYAVYMFYFIVLNNYHAVLPYRWIF